MHSPGSPTELAERLILYAGELAEALASDAAGVDGRTLAGPWGAELLERARSIGLLVEAAVELVRVGTSVRHRRGPGGRRRPPSAVRRPPPE